MCGLTGCWQQATANRDVLVKWTKGMVGSLIHRGPDDEGYWVDESVGLGLGFRRLAIVDLSPNGHQPMVSACGRFVIVFNGEVYNFGKLRQALEIKEHVFRGHSDTEVILAAIAEWGLEAAVKQFVGMFAFALWDRKEQTLSLVRDRLGIKPLYYGWMGDTFLFGSELKALRKHPNFNPDIDRDSLTLLLRYNAIPAPYSIYRGIYKLLPGSILTVSSPNEHQSPVAYWSAHEVITEQLHNPFKGSEVEAIEQLDSLLRDSIALRMIADVPLGAFLSGGIDSSAVVALMQAQSQRAIKTFSIGQHDERYDEAQYAKRIAEHLGTDHTELYVTPQQAMAVIPKLPTLYDEPFSDSSQISTYLVSQLAKEQVTVSLSGDGGDELFAGYNRHLWVERTWQKMKWTPSQIRRGLAIALKTLSPRTWESLIQKLEKISPIRFNVRRPGDKLHKLADIIDADSAQAIYKILVSHWMTPSQVVLGSHEPPTNFFEPEKLLEIPSLTQRMMFLDLIGYLQNDILTKVDRASMGVSLEARVPLLDHRVVEFAWRIPLSMKIKNKQGKWLLRQVLYQYVPKDLIERPKMGFSVPIGAWLQGPLRDWAEALLDESRLRQEGFFDPIPIRQTWHELLSEERNLQYPIWDVLMFQSWLEHNT